MGAATAETKRGASRTVEAALVARPLRMLRAAVMLLANRLRLAAADDLASDLENHVDQPGEEVSRALWLEEFLLLLDACGRCLGDEQRAQDAIDALERAASCVYACERSRLQNPGRTAHWDEQARFAMQMVDLVVRRLA